MRVDRVIAGMCRDESGFSGVNDDRGVGKETIPISGIMGFRSAHEPEVGRPGIFVKDAAFIEIFEQARSEARSLQKSVQSVVCIEDLVSVGANLHPLDIGRVRKQSIRNGDPQIASRAQIGEAIPGSRKGLFGGQMLPDMFRENGRNAIGSKIALPVLSTCNVQDLLVRVAPC